jgi:3-methyladenine DNA glycosylase AlkD
VNKTNSFQISNAVLHELEAQRNADKAAFFPRFFKTGKGEYGEGDVFWGISVPENRAIAKKYFPEISIDELCELLKNPVHEVRACALFMMVYRYESKKLSDIRKEIYQLYIAHTKYINNWDLVDNSAAQIVGAWLFDKKRDSLYTWAKKGNLWEQRIAIISTFYFIRKNQFEDTVAICKLLLTHEHDLIHKATGWMLREVGKRNEEALIYFLAEYHEEMPRTMLRYAIEKLPESRRKRILEGKYF